MVNVSQRTVLVVDDDRAIRRVLRSALERLDYRVVESVNGEHALEILDGTDGDFAAVISDIGMPRLDGIELVEGIARRGEELPVILTSGRHSVTSLPAAVRTRIAGFLAKPYSLADVTSAVARATASPRGEHDAS